MVTFPIEITGHWVSQFVWIFTRITGFLVMFPVTGSLLPASTRLLLATIFSAAVLLSLSESSALHPPQIPQSTLPLSFISLIAVVQEFLTGLLFGLVLTLWFSLFSMAGHIIGLQMGLGMAQMNDPVGGISVTVISQIYQFAALIMFFLVDGHTTVIAIVLESFRAIPAGSGELFLPWSSIEQLLNYGGWIFSAALILAMPVLIALLVINIAFGFMSRAAPQLNLLSLGFPLSLLSGLLLISFGFEQFSGPFQRFTREAILLLRQLTQT